MKNLLEDDLNHVITCSRRVLPYFKNKRIFITGGTGFFGRWLLEAFLWANDRLDLNLQLTILTRSPEAFARELPRLAQHNQLVLWKGDVRSFEFPQGNYDYVIHAATPASISLQREGQKALYSTIIEGTERTLKFAKKAKVKNFLLISSGAVYGKRFSDEGASHESDACYPDIKNAYALGKYHSERLAQIYRHEVGLKIARPFAFVGPYLPLNIHYAIGNFIHDGLCGQPIRILGDGAAYRSYLYMSDLVIYLWHILIFGQVARPYNVGGKEALSILELAKVVAKQFHPELEVTVAKEKSDLPAPYYVPDTSRAKLELGLSETVDLTTALKKTIAWHQMLKLLS